MIEPILGAAGAAAHAPARQPQGASLVSSFADALREAESAAVAGVRGQLPAQETIMKVMEAERTVSAALAIREKAVSAYLELSRMQI